MSALDRNWTLELQVTKQAFCNCFYQVVSPDAKAVVFQNTGLGNSPEKDIFGTLRNDTFDIWKRKEIFDLNATGLILDGKIIDRENSITLELRILNNLTYNYVRLSIIAAILTPVSFLVLTRILSFFHLDLEAQLTIYTWITLPILFILCFFLQVRSIQKYLDKLKELYTQVLKKIEEKANETAPVKRTGAE